MHDPVAFKPFSEHSHIVTLSTTGNVYLYESLKNMGGHDAIDNSPYKKFVYSANQARVLMPGQTGRNNPTKPSRATYWASPSSKWCTDHVRG